MWLVFFFVAFASNCTVNFIKRIDGLEIFIKIMQENMRSI